MDLSKRTIGVNPGAGGQTAICLWGPLLEKAELLTGNEVLPLQKGEEGYWTAQTDRLPAGSRYTFRVNGKEELPDPASLFQPEGVHGPSEVVDLAACSWTDSSWQNHALSDYIIYELHTGTFTREGTFAALEEKLPYLKELGITAIEIMPLAQFPGSRNWGYDGVFPFAVQDSYGGPEGLQRLVDACHREGLAVILDVVYNHLGPEGNYLGSFGPYFTNKYKTPWGNALNFDDAWCDGVREYFIENAVMWFRDFHIDALRLDAVHAIKDFSPVHLLRAIRERVDALMKETGRTHYLIVELDLNDTRFINSTEREGFGMDAQWVDEFHHALRVAAGGERTGYYEDFSGLEHLAKAYSDAYVYDGQFSPHRKKRFGVKTSNAGEQFIVFSQNHDQVGNRMLGERTSQLVSPDMQRLLAGAVLASPFLPMLFMGEEWSEPNPFLYFVSHTDPELAKAVREGRKAEFAAFHAQGEAPDPVSEETFLQSKLQWNLLEETPHADMLRYYKALIALRRSHPLLRPNRSGLRVQADTEKGTLRLVRGEEGHRVCCLMNFSKTPAQEALPEGEWKLLLHSADSQWGGPEAMDQTTNLGGMVPLPPESFALYEAAGPQPALDHPTTDETT
jgi:maltooligosyltrehalose trehalohydrolase